MKQELVVGLLIVVISIMAGGVLFFNKSKNDTSEAINTNQESSKTGVPFIEIVDPAGFVNTNDKPITIGEYVSKQVILLDVMTYSCINCQRTFPYVTSWYEKYKDDGLLVIGLHTPEFAFEKDKQNVEAAMKEFGITFPVVLDNNYATWRALGNRFWPRKYLIDIHGNIVYDHIGEGAYEETEMKIKELLQERASVLGLTQTLDATLATDEIKEAKTTTRSPETYFGSLRNELLANGPIGRVGIQSFVVPSAIQPNQLYLGGEWNITDEYAEAVNGGLVHYRYNAREVFLVAESDEGGSVALWQDGKPIEEVAGVDAPNGIAPIKSSRLYKLINNKEAGEHLLELRVSPGTKLFAFTFG